MKLSELDINITKLHLRVEEMYDDILIDSYIKMAKKYVLNYTGLAELEAEEVEDLSFAVLALVGDFYENRLATTNSNIKPNKVVESILDMHSVNYL